MVSLPFPPHSRSGPSVPRITAPLFPVGFGFEQTGRQSGFAPPAKCFSDSFCGLGDLALGSIEYSDDPRLNRSSPELFPNESGDHAGFASTWPLGGVSRITGVCGAPDGSNAITATCPAGVT